MRLYGSIRLSALRHNLSRVRDYSPASKIMGVVKSNGYGHGLVRIAKSLQSGVDAFAVATVDEAVELRDSNIEKPVCALSGFCETVQVSVVQARKIDCVIYCDEQIEILRGIRSGNKVSIWIKVDTGMNRLGFPIQNLSNVLETVDAMPFLELKGIISHFASADGLDSDFTSVQIGRFKQCTKGIDTDRSIANSAGIVCWKDSHFDWVRPGIMLYGASPIVGMTSKELDLQPVMELHSTIISVKQLRVGDSVGYGQTWTCTEDSRIGIVGCGYGDGYFRSASSKSQVLIDGSRADVIGRISMDMLAVNLNQHQSAGVGSSVKLFGEGLPVEELADAVGTISYEILTSVNSRSVLFREQ